MTSPADLARLASSDGDASRRAAHCLVSLECSTGPACTCACATCAATRGADTPDGVLLASGGLVIVRATPHGEIFIYVSNAALEPDEHLAIDDDDEGTYASIAEARAMAARLLASAAAAERLQALERLASMSVEELEAKNICRKGARR